jgi:hypothetical protein
MQLKTNFCPLYPTKYNKEYQENECYKSDINHIAEPDFLH